MILTLSSCVKAVQQLNDLQIQRGELSEKNVYYAKYTTDINNVKAAIAESVNSMRVSLAIEKSDLKQRTQAVENEIQHLPAKYTCCCCRVRSAPLETCSVVCNDMMSSLEQYKQQLLQKQQRQSFIPKKKSVTWNVAFLVLMCDLSRLQSTHFLKGIKQ